MRDILNPPDRLTIVQTESMVIITGPDGRTTRLSPDGKKIKDDSTKIERRTKWDGGKLVSEIGGLPLGKITETWSVDPEHRQLHISLKNDDDRRPLMVTRVYDADAAVRSGHPVIWSSGHPTSSIVRIATIDGR